MKFLQVLDGAEVLSEQGNPDIKGIEYDSRRVRPGFLFVAMKGETTDGNQYIDKAIEAGAVAVVSDSQNQVAREKVAWAQVAHGRRALGRISANFYGRPAEKIKNTGVTGTNGKTTTAFLMEGILKTAGRKCSLVGTVEYHVGDRILEAPHTTPESLDLNRLLSEALSLGVTENVMEVSSHGLEQGRVFGIPYDVAVFTNLTRDHLDYHGTFDEYFASKRILFEGSGTYPPRVAIINADDEYGRKLVPFSKQQGSEVLTYSLTQGEIRAENLEIAASGSRFDLVMPSARIPLFSPMIGKVNVYNLLAATGAAYARGCSEDEISRGVEKMAKVPGRFERVDCGQPFTVVVDYAHTDDALRNLTSLARDFVRQSAAAGRVITVFGCGGDRDRAKRPLMGEAAGQGSDLVYVTSDNPRSEDPMSIIRDAVPGIQKTQTKFIVEPDRRHAIELALQNATVGDIVLLAGKGHEKTQTSREGDLPFDDVEVAQQALTSLGYRKPQRALTTRRKETI